MNDPQRLLRQGASEHERRMLLAGAAEEPPPDGAERLALALGLGNLPPVEGAAEQGAAKFGASKGAAQWLSAKWLAIGGVSVAIVTAGALLTQRTAPRGESNVNATAAAPSEPEAVAATPAPSVEQPAARSIAEEIALLDEVRAALRARAHEDALRSLDRYQARFPSGALVEEALFMEIEALSETHAREARAHAVRFLHAYPNSVHGARVRTILKALDGK